MTKFLKKYTVSISDLLSILINNLAKLLRKVNLYTFVTLLNNFVMLLLDLYEFVQIELASYLIF